MNHVERATDFYVELAKTMQALSFSSDAIEDAIVRIARGHGLDVELLALPNVVIVESHRDEWRRFRAARLPFQSGWQLSRVKLVLHLVDEMSVGRRDFAEGRAELNRIRSHGGTLPAVAYAVAYVVYSGAIAIRIGGSWLEGVVGAVVGAVMWRMAQGQHRGGVVVESFVAAFVATVAVLGLTFLLPPFDTRTALFGGIALLVPAMAMTTASHELAQNRLEAGTVRLIHALLRFVLLGAGITAAFRVFGHWWEVPIVHTAEPLTTPVVVGVVTVGACALAVHLRADGRDLPWIVGAVLLALGSQALATRALEGHGTAFAAALAVSTFGYLQARIPGHVPAIVIVPGLLQLVPGLVGTRGVMAVIAGSPGGNDTLLAAFLVIFQLIIGFGLVAGLFNVTWKAK